MKNIKRSYIFIFILILIFFISFGASYAILMNKSEHHGKLNIVAGDLNYKIESQKLINNKITVNAGAIEKVSLTLKSLNKINSKYELYYTLNTTNSDVSVGYSIDTKDSVLGTIDANGIKNITLVIKNSSNQNVTVTLGVTGGLMNNILVLSKGNSLNQLIEIPKSFAQIILDNNNIISTSPTLTNSSNNTSDASGLYKSIATNSGDPTYYFRGNVENNYVEFAGIIWRIVRINEDGTVRMIMQDGLTGGYMNAGVFPYAGNPSQLSSLYYDNSSAVSSLASWYKTNIEDSGNSGNVSTGNYYCQQAKVAYSNIYATNSGANMLVYSSYTPNFKCENDANGYGMVNSNIGLISYDEVVFAGGYYNLVNSSYYLNNGKIFWTISPSGVDSNNYSNMWRIVADGKIESTAVASYSGIRPVINLKASVTVIGTGTIDDAYKIK